MVHTIHCYSTGDKPRSNRMVPHKQSFCKGGAGALDRRGGGVVLDCRYQLRIVNGMRSRVVRELEDFLDSNDGPESYH